MRDETEGRKQGRAGRIAARIAILFGIALAALLILAYGAMWVICRGPSESARDLFVNTCMETSFARLFPPLVLPQEEIDAIRAANAVVDTDEVTDNDLNFADPNPGDSEQPEIEIVDVIGTTYKGKLMIVKDPSRVVVGTPPALGGDAFGEKLDDMIKRTGAIGGINAGGFADDNGMGSGGTPIGIVIQDGKLVFGSESASTVVIGLDNKNVLHVGRMTAREALDKGMRDAVSFGPALVVNGKPSETAGSGGGLNPRTAIGQREDGSILLLVIDGRQPHSIGASHKDLVDIMVQYGAINAGNLDGGSSTTLYYEGELRNACASLYGPRQLATAFLVK